MTDKKTYAAFCRYLEDACGITLGEHKFYLAEARLRSILGEYELDDLGHLLRLLNSRKEIALERKVIDAMTTNETSWFRDEHPFENFKQYILPSYPAALPRPLRIWSNACSYGQEPYSISISVSEFLERNPGRFSRGVEIVATDISTRVLSVARGGRFTQYEIERGLDEGRRRRYFRESGGAYEVRDEIRGRVSFHQLNLVARSYPFAAFDVIFCRNVLIYFAGDRKKQIIGNLIHCMRPGAFLILGGSEPLANYSDNFNMLPCARGVVYQLKD